MKWQLRQEPLTISGVLVPGTTTHALITRLLLLEDEALEQLTGVVFDSDIILLGNMSLIPWLPDLQYLGYDKATPHLLLPTNLQSDLPADLLEGKILLTHGPGQYALDYKNKRIIPVQRALPLVRSALQALQNDAQWKTELNDKQSAEHG